MIKRIVRMDIQPGKEDTFLGIFEKVKKEIRAQPGCFHLEVLRQRVDDKVFIWTISHWDTVDDLDRYRTSMLFRQTWSAVKPLFESKTEAWTLTPIETI